MIGRVQYEEAEKSPHDSSTLLKSLPVEIIERTLSDFLDGKSLYTLSLALISDFQTVSRHQYLVTSTIREILVSRLKFYCQILETAISRSADTTRAAGRGNNDARQRWLMDLLEWVKECIRTEESAQLNYLLPNNRLSILRQILGMAAVGDFFNVGVSKRMDNFNIDAHRMEWPVWSGSIEVSFWIPQSGHYYAEISQVFIRADIIVYAWQWTPADLLAWYGLHHGLPSGEYYWQGSKINARACPRFVTEPVYNNFLPSPPCTGRIVGIGTENQRKIHEISQHLQEQSFVAVLKHPKVTDDAHVGLKNTIKTIRFISRSQAQLRLEHYRAEGNDNEQFHRWITSPSNNSGNGSSSQDLICCWDCLCNDGMSPPSPLECVPALTSILQRRASRLK